MPSCTHLLAMSTVMSTFCTDLTVCRVVGPPYAHVNGTATQIEQTWPQLSMDPPPGSKIMAWAIGMAGGWYPVSTCKTLMAVCCPPWCIPTGVLLAGRHIAANRPCDMAGALWRVRMQ